MAVREQEVTDRYALYNADCCEVLEDIPDESIGLVLYSPPFATVNGGCLYNYSSSPRDFSNAQTYEEFFEQYDILLVHLSRVIMPGRICAVHCMDVPKEGANICGYSDFPGDLIKAHERHGFEYTPRICIWKEPLAVRNRTMSKALAHKTIVEDATKCNVAAADYLIPFRKKGDNPVPVVHEHGLMHYAGERQMPSELKKLRGFTGKQTSNKYSHWIWRQYASCFWDDIRIDRVLPYRDARDKDDERHQHPLQLDVIDRCVSLWTNENETVLTPFMGVGSEVYGAVSLGRRAIGAELKPSYYRQAVKNLERVKSPAEEETAATLF
jgi:DNA modification methylase